MATANIKVDPGTTTALPTYEITEDAITKEVPRSALNNSAGAELGTTANPVQTALPAATVSTLTPPAAITGFATAAKQLADGHNVVVSSGAITETNSGSIKTAVEKIPAQGQALAAASTPVVLPATQITTLTPPAAITGFATSAKQLADGHNVAVNNASGASAVNIQDGGNTITVDNGGTFAVQSTDSITAKTMKTIQLSYTASQTAATVLTPTAGTKVNIVKMVISPSGAGTLKVFDSTDSTTTSIGGTLALAANAGVVMSFGNTPWHSAANDNVIKYTSGSGSAGSIWVFYYES